jgi:phospholipid/cholesterol/gamma-HCH transport system ATP-binding protein
VAVIPEIELRGIRTVRGDYEVLREVDLSLVPGETLFVMGNAGSGKSVLVKTAAGIALPTEGEVLYRGKSLARMSEREEAAFRKASGFVFQEAALWANQNLFDNLALPARLHKPEWGKAEVERAVRRSAEVVGYDQDLYVRPAELSTGERKLIGLARALVLDPELLFMDDPTSDLDESSAARIFEIVEALKERGRSVLVTSGISEFASRCADRIAVLLNGKLAAVGAYDEAAAWTDPGVRSVTGRLKARVRAEKPAWEDSLAGSWASALAEDFAPEESEAVPWKRSQDGGSPGETLGDIINDIADADAESESEKKDGS